METKLSYCTTCKGRLHHLQETLLLNLEFSKHLTGIEFVLLDYSSGDGLGAWVEERFQAQMDSGALVYYRLDHQASFFMAHAKNVAHRLARGEIVCNLDADNYTAIGFSEFLL